MIQDRPLLGILLMIGFCILAPMGDSIAKLLGGQITKKTLTKQRYAKV